MDAAVRWRDGTPGHRKEKPQPRGREWSAEGGFGYFTGARLVLQGCPLRYTAQAGHLHSECRLTEPRRIKAKSRFSNEAFESS